MVGRIRSGNVVGRTWWECGGRMWYECGGNVVGMWRECACGNVVRPRCGGNVVRLMVRIWWGVLMINLVGASAAHICV